MKRGYIISGGTIDYIDSHFASCAPAFGSVGIQLFRMFNEASPSWSPIHMPTRMALGYQDRPSFAQGMLEQAGLTDLRTTQDLSILIDHLVADPNTRCIIMAAAVADFQPNHVGNVHRAYVNPGKDNPRISSSEYQDPFVGFKCSEKLIDRIREDRKDIFLVSFKQEWHVDRHKLFQRGLRNLKRSSSNLVFANATHPDSKCNMVITPEEYFYEYPREEALHALVEMTCARTTNTFKRTKVVKGELAKIWDLKSAGKIPNNFVVVLAWLIENNAFHEFNDRTAGHFGCKVEDEEYVAISSQRKVSHNDVFTNGMVKIYPSRENFILAEGAKPSVGEHTQQRIYEELGDEAHSIVHFHADCVETFLHQAEQLPFECGSAQCAKNTALNMQEVEPGIYAVHLNGHGPNIAFHKDAKPERIIEFINSVWDFKRNPHVVK